LAPLSRSSWIQLNAAKGESDDEVRRVPTPNHNAAQGHNPIVLICWLQLTEVGRSVEGLVALISKRLCFKH
jgi:hypothetical protein